jgi:(4-alkanoyl-5-oxo-2,5-dihydrofuran-3-yl)methyl phosphate reductase
VRVTHFMRACRGGVGRLGHVTFDGNCGDDGDGSGQAGARRIAVTGAMGTVGRLVAQRLGEQRRHAVTLLSRDPGPARAAGLSGRVVGADFECEASVRRGLEGVDTVLVVTNNPLRPDHDENIAVAARAAGVRHIVKLSAAAVEDPGAQDLVTRWQRAAEERIVGSGLAWTMLRPRSFMTHALAWREGIRRDGSVAALHSDSPNACIAPEDIADVAVRILTGTGHESRSYALTGPQALTVRQQVAALSALLGRDLRCVELSPEQARERWRQHLPEPVVEALAESAERQRGGAKTRVTQEVRRLTGRPALTFAEWAGGRLDDFGAGAEKTPPTRHF